MGFERNYKNQVNGIERRGLGKIFGPAKERNGIGIIKTNY